jgi:hypothetical protein
MFMKMPQTRPLPVRRFLAVNTSRMTVNKVRREKRDGRDFLVAPFISLRPQTLAGSKGGLYYPESEIAANPGIWNGVPLTLSHPTDPLTNTPESARQPHVAERFQLGTVYNDRLMSDGSRGGEAWFDVQQTATKAPSLYGKLMRAARGQRQAPLELSTGLYTDNIPAYGHDSKGKPYHAIATNYKPDHLAVLENQTGACSVEDGCSINLNSLTRNCKPGGKCCGKCRKAKVANYNPDQPRDHGKWSAGSSENAMAASKAAFASDTRSAHNTAAQAHRAAARTAKADYDRTGNPAARAAMEQHNQHAILHQQMAMTATRNAASFSGPNTTPAAISGAEGPMATAPHVKPQKGVTDNDGECDCDPDDYDCLDDCLDLNGQAGTIGNPTTADAEVENDGADSGNMVMTPAGAVPTPDGGTGMAGSPLHIGPTPTANDYESKFWRMRQRVLANARTNYKEVRPMSLEQKLINNMLSRPVGDVLAEPGLYSDHAEAIANGASHTGYHSTDPQTGTYAAFGPHAATLGKTPAHVTRAALNKAAHVAQVLAKAGYAPNEVLFNVTSQFEKVDRPLSEDGSPLPFGLSTDPTIYHDQRWDEQARDGTDMDLAGRRDVGDGKITPGPTQRQVSRDDGMVKGFGYGGSPRVDRRKQGSDVSDDQLSSGVLDAGEWDADEVRGPRGTRVVQAYLKDATDDQLAALGVRRTGTGAWPDQTLSDDQAGSRPAARTLPRPRVDADADESGDTLNNSLMLEPAGYVGTLGR